MLARPCIGVLNVYSFVLFYFSLIPTYTLQKKQKKKKDGSNHSDIDGSNNNN